jgi:hypothetical protein
MDKATIATAVIRGIALKRGEALAEHERKYVVRRIHSLELRKFAGSDISDIIMMLVSVLTDEMANIPKAVKENSIDIHEMLLQEIGKEPESRIADKKIESCDTVDSLLKTPRVLQNVFNPRALYRKTYLVLDRRYQASDSNNQTTFKWNIANASKTYNRLNTAATTAPLKDVVSIKMLPFRFPNTTYALRGARRLSVEIVEFDNMAHIITAENRRFHFLFELAAITAGSPLPLLAQDIGNNSAEFSFHEPVIDVNTLTLRFGNPGTVLSLDPDVLYGVITSVGATSVITFTQPHRTGAGDFVYISGFTTSDPVADADLISAINDTNGLEATVVATNSITVAVDLSTAAGIITVDPCYVYLGGKQFMAHLELTYISPV